MLHVKYVMLHENKVTTTCKIIYIIYDVLYINIYHLWNSYNACNMVPVHYFTLKVVHTIMFIHFVYSYEYIMLYYTLLCKGKVKLKGA